MRSGPLRARTRGVAYATRPGIVRPQALLREAAMAIDVATSEDIALITINRPEALNAFNAAQLDLLTAALRSVGQDRSVRVVIITGAGDRAFAAGADIKEMVAM